MKNKQSPPAAPSPFVREVSRVIRRIPPGRTLGYGQVALLAGKPGGARAVVRALRALEDVPWWRVVRSDGSLAAEVAQKQAKKLAGEGVVLKGRKVPAEVHGLAGTARRR